MPTVEERLAEWQAQSPACRTTGPEWQFIRMVRDAASKGVGYGWMQQVIEWEWQASCQGMAWGPEHFQQRIAELEAEVRRLRRG